jgi:hypothetical protein
MLEARLAADVVVTESTAANQDSEPNVQLETDPAFAFLLKAMLLPVAWATSALVSSAQAVVAVPDAAAVADEAPLLLPDLEQAPSAGTHGAPVTARCTRARVAEDRIRPPYGVRPPRRT